MRTGRPTEKTLPVIALVAALLTPAAGAAPTASGTSRAADSRKGVAITIYNQNLALVKETRNLALARGTNELRFMDVASQIDPKTVHLVSLTDPEGLGVLEQNYEYDLISPDKLMQRFIGRKVTLVFGGTELSGPAREVAATLVSTNGGMVYEIDGKYHVNPPARVVLPEIPGGLISVPTLVWLLDNQGRSNQTAEVSYLTGGISWAADYVGVVDAADARLDLTGWVTIENSSGATYDDATLKLVAGDVNRARPEMQAMGVTAEYGSAKFQPAFAEESFYEYHLYTLDRPATIKDRQTKQISLLEAPGVPVRKIYLLSGQPSYYRSKLGALAKDLKVGVFLEMDNTAANGLGIPLPRGVVRLYKKDNSGSLQFVGEDRIDHTPKDEKVTLKTGDAFDVVADRVQTDYRATSGGRYDAEVEFRISVRNHKTEPVTVTVRDPVPGDWKVLDSTLPHVKRDAHTIEFEVPVPADGETVLTYRVAVDWN